MRIAFVLSGLTAGGAEKVVNGLAHHRRAHGDDVAIFAVNAAAPDSYYPYAAAIPVHPLGGSDDNRRPMLKRISALRTALTDWKPDLVVSFLTKINVMTNLALTGLGIPLVISERNNFKVQRMNPIWLGLGALAARRAAAIVMLTQSARAALPSRLRSRAVVIPNLVSQPKDIAPRQDSAVRLIATGRLTEQKGFDLLLRAFAQISDRLPELRLTIYGEGPDRAALESQARELGIADRVAMPGVTPSPASWISPGDIFVLSSRYEGFANVLLEALAGGMATIAFDCPWGPSDILAAGDAGLLVPATDVRALADAIHRVATDEELRCRLSIGGCIAAARYSPGAIFAQWDGVIAAAIADLPVTAPVRA